ncbi:hypothetical protein A3L10_07280 [Thermococcus radiotolerans]|uniref:Uncharacterized protein n=2 Tax=Thermococcus radiotolerans TaxID=187880 RepID=A0A2Z2N2U1_9EURY|nr:hypothetical protein A3L10_07280 [Thermococcus radiotolerans]
MVESEYCYVPFEIRDLEKFLQERGKKEDWNEFMDKVDEIFSSILEPYEEHIMGCIKETEKLLARYEGDIETYREVSHRLSFLTGELNRTLSTLWHRVVGWEVEEIIKEERWPRRWRIVRRREWLGDLGEQILELLRVYNLRHYISGWLDRRRKTFEDFLSVLFFEKTWKWLLRIISELEHILTKMRKQLKGMNFHEAPTSFSFSIGVGVPPSVSVSYGVGWDL